MIRRALTVPAALLLVGSALAARAADPQPWTPTGPVAVLPVHNLSGTEPPTVGIENLLRGLLAARAVEVVDPVALEAVLLERRIRFTGGLDAADAAALQEQLGARSFVVSTIDLWSEGLPPRCALTARVIDPTGRIVASAEVALAGEDHPGALGLGFVDDPDLLLEDAVAELVAALVSGSPRAGARRDHRPKRSFVDPELSLPTDRPLRVAVLPFENRRGRLDLGVALAGLLVHHLAGRGVEVLEPGVVRAALLRHRVVQDWGVSLAQADALRVELEADLVVTGRVLAFEDGGPDVVPRVAMSVRAIATASRQAVWSCYSANRGSDGVVLFDAGRMRTARRLASSMIRSAAEDFLRAVQPGGQSR